jgi:hypothetical protein
MCGLLRRRTRDPPILRLAFAYQATGWSCSLGWRLADILVTGETLLLAHLRHAGRGWRLGVSAAAPNSKQIQRQSVPRLASFSSQNGIRPRRTRD